MSSASTPADYDQMVWLKMQLYRANLTSLLSPTMRRAAVAVRLHEAKVMPIASIRASLRDLASNSGAKGSDHVKGPDCVAVSALDHNGDPLGEAGLVLTSLRPSLRAL